jgi:integrase
MWDSKESMPKKKHPLYTELAAIISQAKTEVSREVLTLAAEEKEYSLAQLKTISRKQEVGKHMTVLDYFKQTEERLMAMGRIGYGKVFQYTHNSLKAFSGKDFEFIDVNTSFLMRYEEWFLRRGVKPNSVFVFMRTFKTLVNYARKEGLVKPAYDPFKEFSFSKYRRIRTVKRAITKEQIQQIAAYPCKTSSYQLHARNYFMFSYYNRGINFIDMAFLRWNSIDSGRLIYTRKKTQETFTIKLLKPSLDILDYYRSIRPCTLDDYIFPILNKRIHISPRQIDDRVDKVIKRVNNALKQIGKELGIQAKLTTYVARHSFATVLKRSGTPIALISELLGHDSEQTTKVYLNDFDNEVLDMAAEAAL